jgi:hypothetical protein
MWLFVKERWTARVDKRRRGICSQLPLIVDPEELLGYIRAHLTYVLAFARVRVAYKEALKPAQEGQ